MIRTRSVAVGLTLAVAGCEAAPADSRDLLIGNVEQLCAQTGNPTPFTAEDAQPLPPLGSKYQPSNGTQTYIGRMVVQEGNAVLQLSPVPEELADSILKGFGPSATCAIATYGWSTRINLTRGKGNGGYDHEDNAISMNISTSADAEKRALPERGAPRLLLVHEVAHGYVDRWLEMVQKKEGGDVTHGINELHRYYLGELQDSVEAFRTTHGIETTQDLSTLKETVERAGNNDLAKALQEVMDSLAVEKGLESLGIGRHKRGYGKVNFFWDVIKKAGERVGADVDDDDYKAFKKQLDPIIQKYWLFLEEQFAQVDESSTLSSVIRNNGVGHPYEDFNEWLASLITTLHFNYLGMTATVNLLPTERQVRYGYAVKILELLSEDTAPELHEALPFEDIKKELSYA